MGSKPSHVNISLFEERGGQLYSTCTMWLGKAGLGQFQGSDLYEFSTLFQNFNDRIQCREAFPTATAIGFMSRSANVTICMDSLKLLPSTVQSEGMRLCCAPCCAVPCRAVLYNAPLFCAVMQYAMLSFAVSSSCCAVLCCAVLCCAVLCCAALRCAVLCCAVLCCPLLFVLQWAGLQCTVVLYKCCADFLLGCVWLC